MGVFGLVNGEWKFFPNVAAAQAAGAVNISKNPELRNKPGGPPRDPRMYWGEMTGQWRFPQPMAPFPPGVAQPKFPRPTEWAGPDATYPNWDDPPGPFANDVAITAIPSPPSWAPPTPPTKPNIGPEWSSKNPFEDYVRKYPDLMAAYKKHKSKGGKGDASSWGKLHFDRHGKNEKRVVPGLKHVVGPGFTPRPDVPKTAPKTVPKKPDWGKYLSSNPDLVKAFGTDTAKAKQHWAQFGSKEKRKFTPYA